MPAAPAAGFAYPSGASSLACFGFGSFAVAVCLAIAWAVARRAPANAVDPSHPLWARLFDKSHQTLIVPSDDGIVMIQNLTGHLVPLSEYINRDYLSLKSPYNIDAQNMRDLDAQRYTNVTDLNAVMRFSRFRRQMTVSSTVRYSRDLHMEDLKDANVILLGSSFSNPWAELFEKIAEFRVRISASSECLAHREQAPSGRRASRSTRMMRAGPRIVPMRSSDWFLISTTRDGFFWRKG